MEHGRLPRLSHMVAETGIAKSTASSYLKEWREVQESSMDFLISEDDDS